MVLRIIGSKSGAVAAEYALILSLITLTIISSVIALGGGSSLLWNNVSASL
jgi:Flp pilus assembly pilin Flp